MNTTRRSFIGAGIATLAATAAARSQSTMGRVTKPHVVIIGGGAGGATAAKYLAKDGAGQIDVTLIEANKTYQSCFFSNHYIGGLREFSSLTHNYEVLKSKFGIQVVHDRAVNVDRTNKNIELENGFLRYDVLVLAPGIDFVEGSVNGWSMADQRRMPHAYKGGEQARLLKAQIDAMPQGGVFAIVPPAGSYRCPPGPYERVCVVANLLKTINPTAKIIIADPKPVFSKMGLFREAWKKYYKGMIAMNSDVDLTKFSVDPKAMTINLDDEVIKVDACNVIPGQKAGMIAHIAGVAENDWAPVHAQDMRSMLDENIYILGDAADQGAMPKSGFSANSQAKVCANAILGRLTGAAVFTPRFSNTCWSMVAENNSVKIGANYRATPDGIAKVDGFVSRRKEDAATRKETYDESLSWYSSITEDMFEANS